MTRLLGLLGSVPHALVIKAAIYGLVFLLGMAIGNTHATQRALTRELQASADRQRENHRQLLAYQKDVEHKLKAEAERSKAADAEAFKVYQAAIVAGARDLKAARGVIENERAKSLNLTAVNNGLKGVNEVLAGAAKPDPGCVLDGRVRGALNAAIASINNHPNIGSATPEGPGVPDGPNPSDTVLTCSELAASVTDILEHDAMLTAWVLSFQAWEVEVSR